MRILIFAGQAPFGSAMQQVVCAQTGADHIYGIDLESGSEEAVDALQKVFTGHLQKIVDQNTKGNTPVEIVLLSDVLSSQAHVLASQWAKNSGRNVLMIAGTNVPMALDAVYLKDDVDSLKELEESLRAEGSAGITGFIFDSASEQ